MQGGEKHQGLCTRGLLNDSAIVGFSSDATCRSILAGGAAAATGPITTKSCGNHRVDVLVRPTGGGV